MYIVVLLAYLCVHHIHAWCPQKSEGGQIPRTKVTDISCYVLAGNQTRPSARTSALDC